MHSVQAAKESGAVAVHPGYGFLSESPEMVAEVEGAGLVWLGPDAPTIRDFALKHVAKDMAVAAGVPTLSGSPLVTTEEGKHFPPASRATTFNGSLESCLQHQQPSLAHLSNTAELRKNPVI